MKISTFKRLTDKTPDRYSITIEKALDNISSGKYKDLIKELRNAKTKSEKDILKKKLPAVTFGGTFESRSKDGLKEASGFMCIDFDNLEDPKEFRWELELNSYIYSAWISPSGTGVKALVKIPVVNSNDQYASYYSAFVNALKEPSVDTSGKDISRLCFESYDPELFINDKANIWTEFDSIEIEIPVVSHEYVTTPCTDNEEIIRRLLKWFEGKYNPNQRNNSINILAFSFNIFGVDINSAKSICLRYQQRDFPESEILKTVESAYSKKELFGTKQFQDNKKRDFITSFSISEVTKKFPEVAPEIIRDLIEASKEICFWTQSEKGIIKIVPSYFRDYLHDLGFNKILFSSDSKVVSFIRKEGKFVREYQVEEVKDFVLNDMESRGEMDVWNILANSPKYFQESYLSMLHSKVVDVEKDGEDYALFYFKNTVVKVSVDNIEMIDYNDLPKSVWETQVLNRNFNKCDHHESDFRTFIWNVCGQNVDNYNSFKSIIGRMLHTYKTTSKNRAIIANDDNLSEEPNGGSGKSLLALSIGQLRKVSIIDGKNFDFGKQFNYQTVPIDTQVLVYDDIAKNFEFERLFSVITGGITIEYKGTNAIKLPVTDSPQIYINTNYTVRGTGGSFDRRKHEIEFSSHYHSGYSPEDEFGKRFFDEWSDEEWARFDNYMINCLQYFLKNGLVKQDMVSIREKKFRNETSIDWVKFISEKRFINNQRFYKQSLKEEFLTENDHYKELTNKTLKKWLDAYGSFVMKNVHHDRDVKGYFVEFYEGERLKDRSEESIELIEEAESPF
jgi:hypothetical protein